MAILSIPVTKAGNATIDFDTDTLPESVYELALREGLKVLLNKKMSKVTTAKLEGEELAKAQAAAMEIAQKNAEEIRNGTVKVGRSAKKSTVKGVVMTEARRLAKAVIKDQIRAAGGKISHYKASDITAAANALIEQDQSFIAQAEKNLAEREGTKPAIDISAIIKPDAALIAKADEKKAAAKASGTLSKTQAGKPAPRKGAKPGKESGATA